MSIASWVSSRARSSRCSPMTSRRPSQRSRNAVSTSLRCACSRMWKILSSMIVILSTSEPIVSATLRASGSRRAFPRDDLAEFFVDALDQIVPLLIQLVHVALGGGDLMVVLHPRFVLFVPELDVRHRETRNELAQGVCHRGQI